MDELWNRLPNDQLLDNRPVLTDTRMNDGGLQGYLSELEYKKWLIQQYQDQMNNRRESRGGEALQGLQRLFNQWYGQNSDASIRKGLPEVSSLRDAISGFRGFSPGDRERMNRMFLEHMWMSRLRQPPQTYGM